VARNHPIPADTRGTIYLLHYSARTNQRRQHYLGWSSDVVRRFAQHRSGCGCRETAKAVAEGLQLTLAQTWRGTPRLEQRLKEWSREGRKGFSGICPFCDGSAILPLELRDALGPPSLKRRHL
jgi:predicted GIY-YIG superfamily endonuclease